MQECFVFILRGFKSQSFSKVWVYQSVPLGYSVLCALGSCRERIGYSYSTSSSFGSSVFIYWSAVVWLSYVHMDL
jgi:hypothetical protein